MNTTENSGGGGVVLGFGHLYVDWWERSRGWVVHPGQAIGKVIEKPLTDGVVNSLHASHEPADFVGTLGETRAEFSHHSGIRGQLLLLLLHLKILQMFDGHLQDICLLKFRVSGIIFF